MICILFEDRTGVMVLLYGYHKSGLVPSTPSSQFRHNSLWDSRLLLSMVVRAFPCFVLTSNKGYALIYVGCFLLIQVVFGYRYCYTVIMRWHCIVSLLDSMLILLTVNRAARLLCVMHCKFILVEASMYIEYNCLLQLCL